MKLITVLRITLILSLITLVIIYVNLNIVLSENKLLKSELRAYETELDKTLRELNYYKSELNKKIAEYDKLLIKYNEVDRWLKANITYYESHISKLKTELQTYASELEYFRSYLSKAVIPNDLPYKNDTLNKIFLDNAVNSLRYVSGLLPVLPSSAEDMIVKLIEWVSNNTYYQYDPSVMKDHWKLPNETIKDQGGDCDDLAVLGYALLKSVGFKDVYLLIWRANDSAHVGVLVYVDGKWFLVDPTWAYVNDYGLRLSFDMLRIDKSKWVIHVVPSHLHPTTKKYLLDGGFTRYQWYDYRTNRYITDPIIGRQISLKELLLNWPRRGGYEARVWSLIAYDRSVIDTSLDSIVEVLNELTRR